MSTDELIASLIDEYFGDSVMAADLDMTTVRESRDYGFSGARLVEHLSERDGREIRVCAIVEAVVIRERPEPEPARDHISYEFESIDTLRTCRDHWKTAFEHERENVIRLRAELRNWHNDPVDGMCTCRDCQLVRNPPGEPQ